MSANVKVHFVYSSSVATATVKKETQSGATHEWFKLNEALWSEQGVRGVQTVLGSPVKIQVGEKVTLNNAHMDFKSNHTRMADGTPQYTWIGSLAVASSLPEGRRTLLRYQWDLRSDKKSATIYRSVNGGDWRVAGTLTKMERLGAQMDILCNPSHEELLYFTGTAIKILRAIELRSLPQ